MAENNKKRFWKFGLIFFAVFFVFFASVHQAQAGPVGAWVGSTFDLVMKAILYGIFSLMSWLVGLAGILFGWVIDPENISFIMENPGIYASWAMVRDFLNLGFILVLLYIAFCVIFQIGSYSDGWKKMLLMMVIMALLVNFSFPICRVIIDVSNITFYYLVNSAFPDTGGDGIFANFAKFSQIGGIIADLKSAQKMDYANLFSIIAFTFLLAVTLMVIAVLFIIRMVALGILVIFSPIGFAGAAFPFSATYAKKWWDELFKNAFFAPIMMFMIIIAFNILKFATDANGKLPKTMQTLANQNLGADPSTGPPLGEMAFFAIPIVILWFGMSVAQQLKIVGAAAVTGTAQKAAKWAGKKVSGISAVQGKYKQFKAGMDKRSEDETKKSLAYGAGRGLTKNFNRGVGALPIPIVSKRMRERARKMRESDNRSDIEDDSKKYIESGMTARENVAKMRTASKPTEAAAHARAFLKQDGDDRKNFVENEARSSATGGSLNEMFNQSSAAALGITGPEAAAHDAKLARLVDSQRALHAEATGGPRADDQHKKDLHAFVNDFMKRKVVQGIKS